MSIASAQSLRCPGCGAGMCEVDSGGVLIDVCPECKGLWLDKGQLEQLGGVLPARQSAPRESGHVCPRCHFPMDERVTLIATVDLCWGCGGLYVGSAAFDALVEARGGRAPVFNDGVDDGQSAIPGDAERAEEGAAESLGERLGLFWCELCRAPTPIEERVVGERIDVCPKCAAKHEIRHDPEGRSMAERMKEDDNRFRVRSVANVANLVALFAPPLLAPVIALLFYHLFDRD